jgi:hypothetical protein
MTNPHVVSVSQDASKDTCGYDFEISSPERSGSATADDIKIRVNPLSSGPIWEPTGGLDDAQAPINSSLINS